MAPAAQRQRAETSVGRKPRSGPHAATASRIRAVRYDAVTVRGVLYTRAKGMVGGAECRRR